MTTGVLLVLLFICAIPALLIVSVFEKHFKRRQIIEWERMLEGIYDIDGNQITYEQIRHLIKSGKFDEVKQIAKLVKEKKDSKMIDKVTYRDIYGDNKSYPNSPIVMTNWKKSRFKMIDINSQIVIESDT